MKITITTVASIYATNDTTTVGNFPKKAMIASQLIDNQGTLDHDVKIVSVTFISNDGKNELSFSTEEVGLYGSDPTKTLILAYSGTEYKFTSAHVRKVFKHMFHHNFKEASSVMVRIVTEL